MTGDLTPAARQILREYPTPAHFGMAYNANMIDYILMSGKSLGAIARNEDIPALVDIRNAYGVDKARDIVSIQLHNLNKDTSQERGMTQRQLDKLSLTIVCEYYYLNIAEIAYFVHMVFSGCFEQFYGAVDPIKVGMYLRQFFEMRSHAIDEELDKEKIRKDNEERANRSANCITLDEYRERCQKEGKELFLDKAKDLYKTENRVPVAPPEPLDMSPKTIRDTLNYADPEFIRRRDEMIRRFEEQQKNRC